MCWASRPHPHPLTPAVRPALTPSLRSALLPTSLSWPIPSEKSQEILCMRFFCVSFRGGAVNPLSVCFATSATPSLYTQPNQGSSRHQGMVRSSKCTRHQRQSPTANVDRHGTLAASHTRTQGKHVHIHLFVLRDAASDSLSFAASATIKSMTVCIMRGTTSRVKAGGGHRA